MCRDPLLRVLVCKNERHQIVGNGFQGTAAGPRRRRSQWRSHPLDNARGLWRGHHFWSSWRRSMATVRRFAGGATPAPGAGCRPPRHCLRPRRPQTGGWLAARLVQAQSSQGSTSQPQSKTVAGPVTTAVSPLRVGAVPAADTLAIVVDPAFTPGVLLGLSGSHREKGVRSRVFSTYQTRNVPSHLAPSCLALSFS